MAIAPITPTQTTGLHQVDDPFRRLRAAIGGEVIVRGEEGYEDARTVQVANYDRRPSAIVRVRSTEDVAAAVRFAARRGMPLAVRSGGHSVPGLSMVDGGVTIDLSGMKAVVVDAKTGRARVQAGATSGDVAGPAHEHGFAITTGDTSTVGMGGLVTGGGIGFLARKYGLTIDNLVSAKVVTADGEVRTASAEENPDLFWAIRGGGGNFGIVTEFELQLAPVETVLAGVVVLPATHEALRGYLDYMAGAPEGLTTLADVTLAPPAPFIPEDRVGTPVISVLTIWTGDVAEGQQAIAPLRALAQPIADTIDVIPYPAVYEYTAPLRERHGVALRSMFSDEFSDQAIDDVLEAIARPAAPVSMVHIRAMGGAIARVPADATAFSHRSQQYFVSVIAVWPPDDMAAAAAYEAWATALWDRIRAQAKGVYVNFVQEAGRIGEAYPPETLRRLREVKTKYDPRNTFRYNQNIQPL